MLISGIKGLTYNTESIHHLSVCSFLKKLHGDIQMTFFTSQVKWSTAFLGVTLHVCIPSRMKITRVFLMKDFEKYSQAKHFR